MSKKNSAATRRAARAAQKNDRRSDRWFVVVVAVVAVFGVAVLFAARGAFSGSGSTEGAPQVGDHIHAAYGIRMCGEWQLPLAVQDDPNGLHTHGDGIIHVHPFNSEATGSNATIGEFLDAAQVDQDLAGGSFTYPEGGAGDTGTTFADGDSCPDGSTGSWFVRYWPSAGDPANSTDLTGDQINQLVLNDDNAALAIVFGDPADEIDVPPSVPNLSNLSDVPGGGDGPTPPTVTTPATTGSGAGGGATGGTAPAGPGDGLVITGEDPDGNTVTIPAG